MDKVELLNRREHFQNARYVLTGSLATVGDGAGTTVAISDRFIATMQGGFNMLELKEFGKEFGKRVLQTAPDRKTGASYEGPSL